MTDRRAELLRRWQATQDMAAFERRPEAVEEMHPEMPGALAADYAWFLTTIGSGTLSGDSFTFYGGLVPAEELYPWSSLGDEIYLLGADKVGNSTGFRLPDWTIVELGPRGELFGELGSDFLGLLESLRGLN